MAQEDEKSQRAKKPLDIRFSQIRKSSTHPFPIIYNKFKAHTANVLKFEAFILGIKEL